MKKLNNNQKLIIISIILIVIILAIVITTNIISNNRQISNEEYSAMTSNANSNLVASYIKEGVKVGGITGTLKTLDTSDATATAEDIVKGKTAYVNGVKITGTREPDNYYFTDSLGNTVKVPGGFEVVNPEDNVTDGIIIEDVNAGDEDTKGSQFVWIPVGDVITDKSGSRTKIELGRYTFSSTEVKNLAQSAENGNWSKEVAINVYFKELASSNYGNATAKNLEDFIEKAIESGGYYIGRYEAGDALATTTARKSSTSDTNPMVCKAGVYPYSYVTQLQASDLSKEMYNSSNFDSDLINSYAWDTAVVFLQLFSGDENYSMQIGNNTKNSLQKCGESILKKVDFGDESQDVRCNVYDMAGNTYEWTTETSSYDNSPCVSRGGRYDDNSVFTVGYYADTTTYNYVASSFRPILYL